MPVASVALAESPVAGSAFKCANQLRDRNSPVSTPTNSSVANRERLRQIRLRSANIPTFAARFVFVTLGRGSHPNLGRIEMEREKMPGENPVGGAAGTGGILRE